MEEGRMFGLPVWRFADLRHEVPCIYAPRELGDRSNDERSWINEEQVRAQIRSYVKPCPTLDLEKLDPRVYALYIPKSEGDFNWVCRAVSEQDGYPEIIVPTELTYQASSEISSIWKNARPLHFLQERDLFSSLEVPWVYLLRVYSYSPCLSVFIGESQSIIEGVIKQTYGLEDCHVISLQEA